MELLPNCFGWTILDPFYHKFYYDNWESLTFQDCWNTLWREIIAKFNLIYNQKPSIILTCFIYSPNNIVEINESQIDKTSKSGLFSYNWKITEDGSQTSFCQVSTYRDIISCYNSMINFYANSVNKSCVAKAEIVLVYNPIQIRRLIDITKERNENLKIQDGLKEIKLYFSNRDELNFNNVDNSTENDLFDNIDTIN
jgi:hypothetical protein